MRNTCRIVVLAATLSCVPSSGFAQQPKVTEEQGHLSPVMVKIVFLDGTARTVMLRGVGAERIGFHSHTLGVATDGGASKRKIWLDTIAAIEGTGSMRTRSSDFTVVLKDGKKVAAMFTGSDCEKDIDADASGSWDCRTLLTHNEDGGDQKIDLQKVKSVEFLGPVRRDKAGNAMFDTWKHSPFTGEKLPQ